MTFSTEVKNEITKLESSRLEYISELSALVRNSAIIDDTIDSIRKNDFKAFHGASTLITGANKNLEGYEEMQEFIKNRR